MRRIIKIGIAFACGIGGYAFFGIYGFLLVFGFVLMALAGHFKVWNWGRFKYDEGYNDVPLAIIGAIPLGIAFLHMIGLL